MEFTKLSWRREWQPSKEATSSVKRQGKFYEFPERKKNFGDVEDYLRKADPHRSIRSSISDVLQSAVKAANRAKQLNLLFTGIGFVAILGATIGLYSYFTNTNSYLRRAQDDQQSIRLDLEREKKRSDQLDNEIKALNERLEGYRKQLEELKPK